MASLDPRYYRRESHTEGIGIELEVVQACVRVLPGSQFAIIVTSPRPTLLVTPKHLEVRAVDLRHF